VSTPSSRINAHLQKLRHVVYFNRQKEKIYTLLYIGHNRKHGLLDFILKRCPLQACQLKRRRHECPVSQGTCLMSIAPYVLNMFSPCLVVSAARHIGFALAPFSQLQHEPNTHLISNMNGLRHRPIVHLHSWFGTGRIGNLSTAKIRLS
jgi:hypothetical protein